MTKIILAARDCVAGLGMRWDQRTNNSLFFA